MVSAAPKSAQALTHFVLPHHLGSFLKIAENDNRNKCIKKSPVCVWQWHQMCMLRASSVARDKPPHFSIIFERFIFIVGSDVKMEADIYSNAVESHHISAAAALQSSKNG